MAISNNDSTYPCPNCGEPVGLTTFIGKPPRCASCEGCTVVNHGPIGTEFKKFEENKKRLEINDLTEDDNCLLASLFEDNPQTDTVLVACSCPKCSPRC